MSQRSSQITFKLSPIASVILAVLVLIGGGVVYKLKPELIEPYLTLSGSGKVLSEDRYLPEIKEYLDVYLKSAVVNKLVEKQAPQSKFNQLGEVELVKVTAIPRGYYFSEMKFWNKRDLRHADVFVEFKLGGEVYFSQGDMTVSGVGNHITVVDFRLLPTRPEALAP